MIVLLLWHAAYAFALTVALSFLLIVGYGVFGIAWCKNVFRGGDYTLAAVFGGDGKHSISAYCGLARVGKAPDCLVYLADAIDSVFGDGHCLGAAKREFPEEFA